MNENKSTPSPGIFLPLVGLVFIFAPVIFWVGVRYLKPEPSNDDVLNFLLLFWLVNLARGK